MSDTSFVYVTYVRATPERVWQALTEPALVGRSFEGGGPRSDFRPGSPVLWKMGADDGPHDWGQEVLEADPPRRLVYRWHDYQPEMAEMFGWSAERLAELRREPLSKVAFTIEEVTPTVAKLTVVHDDFVPGSEMLQGVREGWVGILSNLKSLLETGATLSEDVPQEAPSAV